MGGEVLPKFGFVSSISNDSLLSMSQTTQSQTDADSLTADESQIQNDNDAAAQAESGQSGRQSSWNQTIPIARWVVYCQAALLGLIAFSFFMFGMLVGSFTSTGGNQVNARFDCRVLGSVAYRDQSGDLLADEGAVVFLLPCDQKPQERSLASLVSPETFKVLDNPAIDSIHELGGAVVRADQNGRFDVFIDASYGDGMDYNLLIVSKNVRGVATDPMTKEQIAGISTYFAPVEDVVQDRSYYWVKITADGERIDLPEYEFEF